MKLGDKKRRDIGIHQAVWQRGKGFSKKEKDRVMSPSVSAIFKVRLAARNNVLERFSLEAEWACRWLKNRTFTKIFPCSKSVIQVFDWKVENVFRHALLYYRPETASFRTCVTKDTGDDKPLWLEFMRDTTFIVFLNGSQNLLGVLVLIVLDVTTKASLCPQWIDVRVRGWLKSISYNNNNNKNNNSNNNIIPSLAAFISQCFHWVPMRCWVDSEFGPLVPCTVGKLSNRYATRPSHRRTWSKNITVLQAANSCTSIGLAFDMLLL